jgi:hypothetical protein
MVRTLLGEMPSGAFVSMAEGHTRSYLVWDEALWEWSSEGYNQGPIFEPETIVNVLTPTSTVNALKAGYTPG